MLKKEWLFLEKNEMVDDLASQLNLPSYLITILYHRGYNTKEKIEDFLYADKTMLSSPFSLINMSSGVERIIEAIEKGEKITIYGDYDVDGFCSATLLKRAIDLFYDDVSIYIPNRLDEGYGLNETALEKLLNEGTNLVITVYC